MKQIIYFLTLLTILSCKNTKVMSSDISNENNNTTNAQSEIAGQPKDSILQQLRKENDLVLAFEVETVAWGRTSTYKILAKKGNEWKGYTAFVTRTPQRNNPGLTSVQVNNQQAEQVWEFFRNNKILTIPGDKGENFCDDSSKGCNINDGTVWHLLVITKDSISAPTYYEPRFFEKCCPGNQQRKLFLEAVDKLSALVGGAEEEES